MPRWCVNTQARWASGDHEVHDLASEKTCLPAPHSQLALGVFDDCAAAVRQARRHYPDANGCYYCANACHTT